MAERFDVRPPLDADERVVSGSKWLGSERSRASAMGTLVRPGSGAEGVGGGGWRGDELREWARGLTMGGWSGQSV